MNARYLLIGDAPHPGQFNMDVDALLLQRAVHENELWCRLYQWDQPTLSLGHFQKEVPESVAERFQDVPVVKRLSGGGAILHDQEITYSLAIPSSHPWAQDATSIYQIIHRMIIQVLEKFEISSQLRGQREEERENQFLCFLRGDPNDLMIKQDKILGSAQRRRKGAVLQHGSLILRSSKLAPEIAGIEELSGVQMQDHDLLALIEEQFVVQLGPLQKTDKVIDFAKA